MPTCHGVDPSPFVRKVKVICHEKSIAHDSEAVFPLGVSDEYKAISPLGKIPCWTTDSGRNIPDSSCIGQYLEKTHPEPSLYPSEAEDLGWALFLEEYGDSMLAGACGTVFFQRVVRPKFLNETTDEAAVKEALEVTQPPLFSWLDKEIGKKEFLVGNKFSIADIAVTSPFVNMSYGQEHVDASKYPNLARYLAGMFERPSFKKCMEAEAALFA